MQQRVIFVLGMHRSGTSSLAGSLEEAGVHLGDVVTSAPYNKKGNRESMVVKVINDEVLAHSGGTWDAPPKGNVIWTDDHYKQRDEFLKTWLTKPICGLKDPRLLFTIKGWLGAVSNPEYVGTFRNPNAVVKSLRKRPHQLGSDESLLQLWQEYNRRLIAFWDKSSFPLLNFDSDVDEYRHHLQHIFETLHLSSKKQNSFFEPELRNHQLVENDLPSDIQATYKALLERWRAQPFVS